MNESGFDEYLKQQFSQRQIAFNEAHWQAMTTLLDAQQKRRRPIAWWLVLMASLLLVAGMFLFKIESGTTKIHKVKHDKSVKNASPAPSSSPTIIMLPEPEHLGQDTQFVLSGFGKNIHFISKKHTVYSAQHPFFLHREYVAKGGQKPVTYSSDVAYLSTEITKKILIKDSIKTPVPRLGLAKRLIASYSGSSPLTYERVDSSSSVLYEETSKKVDSVLVLPNKMIFLNDSLTTFFAVNDSLLELTRTHYWQPHFSFGLSISMNRNAPSTAPDATLIDASNAIGVGLTTNYLFAPKWSIRGEVYYVNLKNINLNYGTSVIDYHFGFNQKNTNISISRLHFIEIPVTISYIIEEKHSFGAGFGATCLLQTEAIVSNEYRTSLRNGVVIDEKQETGYKQYLNRLNTSIHVSYYLKAHPNMQIGLEGNYSLFSMVKNNDLANFAPTKRRYARLVAVFQLNKILNQRTLAIQ